MTLKSAVHHLALVESSEVGEGTKIWAFSHVMSGARIGANCKIAEHVFIEGGAVLGSGVTVKNGISIWDKVTIEDDVFLGPHMVFTNHLRPRAFLKADREDFTPTRVRKGATIGAGAVLVCGIEIGSYALVGAGAVVTEDVPSHGVVYGNPARLKGFTCRCLKTIVKLTDQAKTNCPHCGDVLPG